MVYLVAKYCLIFLITALLGFLIGRWSIRRLFVDVTDTFDTLSETSRAASEAPWDEIRARFDDINPNVRNIVQNEFRAHPYPEIPRALFEKLSASINDVKSAVDSLPKPERVDLTGIASELRSVSAAVNALTANVNENVAMHADIESLGRSLEVQLNGLEGDIAAIPDALPASLVDFSPLEQKIAALQQSFDQLSIPEQADLSAIETRLTTLTGHVEALLGRPHFDPSLLRDVDAELTTLRSDVAVLRDNTDPSHDNMRKVLAQIGALEQRIGEVAVETANHIDFSPLHEQMSEVISAVDHNNDATHLAVKAMNVEKIERQLDKLSAGVNEVRANQSQTTSAAASIDQRLDKFDRELEQILEQTTRSATELEPLHESISELSDGVEHLALNGSVEQAQLLERHQQQLESLITDSQQHRHADLSPLDQKLDKIQARLSALNEDLSGSIPENGRRPSIGPKLLKRAEFGRKDKLQEIAGIGPKLEQSLNKLGVYYYWQIAAWDKRDIRAVDANLEAFRGRIERDDWVRQAKSLRKLAHAAPVPSGRELAQKLN